ncbi:MAG: FAD binding domain-containing protein, partial [Hungatella sp.]
MFKARNYVKAASLEEAYELNQKKSTLVIGGMLWVKMANYTKMTVVDLSGLGLDKIEETEEAFRIGCMTTLRALELHDGLNSFSCGVMKECTRHIVGVQFRNSATVGGSIYG